MPNLHPLIVHFPIALFITAVVCELLAYFAESRVLSSAALVAGIGAALGALIAVTTGLLAEGIVPVAGEARKVFESHETLGFTVLGIATAFAVLKTYSHLKKEDRLLTALITIGMVGVVFVFITAHEGGELVYKHGVGVGLTQSEATPLKQGTAKSVYQAKDSTRDSVSALTR